MYIKNCFGGKDERAMMNYFENIVGGIKKAQRLLYIWNNSFQNGTKYDMLFGFGRYKTKKQIFEIKAKAEGFTTEQIEVFYKL